MKIPPNPTRRPRMLVLLALAIALAASACASGSSTREVLQARPVGGGLTPLGLQLPATIRNAREIRVGSDISYAVFCLNNKIAPDALARLSDEHYLGVQR